jgi:hypothetical protein
MSAPVQFVDGIRYLKFNKTDVAGRNNYVTLRSIKKIRMTVDNGNTFIDLTVTGVTELSNSVLVQVAPYQINTAWLGFQEEFYFDPYLPEDFFQSDYNALLNNAVESERSDIYFEADYSVSQITASNLPAILSGSAQLAEFNDYNLNLASFTNPRYNGSRLQAAKLNVFTKGDVSYGGDPVINYTDTFFGYFNYIGGTTPERNDTVAAHIGFMVGRNGEAFEPGVSNNAFYNMLNTFESGDQVEIVLDDPQAFDTDMSVLNGMKEIVRAGARIEPIIYSQTGSQLGSRAGSLSFGSDITVNENFKAFVVYSGSSTPVNSGQFAVVANNDEVYDNPNAYSTTTYEYKVPFTSSALINFTAGVKVDRKGTSNYKVDYQVILQRSGSDTGGAFVEVISKWDQIPFNTFNPKLTIIETGPITALSESRYRVRVFCGTTGLFITTGSYLQVNQTIEPPITVSAPYWISGSAVYSQSFYNVDDKYLVAQGSLKSALGLEQKDIAGSGFNTIKYPFQILPGDEIRFEGQENKTHLVTKVYNPQDTFSDYTVGIPPPLGTYGKDLSSGFLIVEVKPNLYPNTNLDNFVIRRYVEDRSFVIFKGNKPSGQTSAGLIKPEYLSQDILDNFDQINRTFRQTTFRNS